MSDEEGLFERVVACTGLAATIGPGTVQRALASVGVTRTSSASPEDYRRALPQLRARMAIYLPPHRVDQHLKEIEGVLRK